MKLKGKKINIQVKGCPMRNLDGKKFEAFFTLNGGILVERPEDADIRIVVACALNKGQIKTSMDALNNAMNSGNVFLTGCLPDIVPGVLTSSPNLEVIHLNNFDSISNYFEDIIVPMSSVQDSNYYDMQSFPVEMYTDRTGTKKTFFTRSLSAFLPMKDLKKKESQESNLQNRAGIKISNGCLFRCTYCGINKAIGRLKSKPLQTCIDEYRSLIEKGERHIVFLADDTGAYGIDIGETLTGLFEKLLETDRGDKTIKWYLQDLNPYWIKKYLHELSPMLKSKRFGEILISAQSGSNRILQLMDRKYTSENIAQVLDEMRNADHSLKIFGNFIFGFPSETDLDYKESKDFIIKHSFDFIFLMPYFENEVSLSKDIHPKVPENVIQKRIDDISQTLNTMRIPYLVVQ